jgi:hypothetical protein
MVFAILEVKLIKLTHRMWNRQISRIICRAYNDNVIDSEQLHVLLAAFDPTQKHMVYGKYAEWSFGMLKNPPKQ